MNNTIKNVLSFVLGGAAGAVVTWKILEKKYKDISDEEIESVRELYNKKLNKANEIAEEQKQVSEYKDTVEYLSYAGGKNPENKTEEKIESIHVIPPEEFGETGYETESLTYYADKVLTYEATDEVVDNVDELVGKDSLTKFGEYEDDSVFVRNEILEKDFEILLDNKPYRPHQVMKKQRPDEL